MRAPQRRVRACLTLALPVARRGIMPKAEAISYTGSWSDAGSLPAATAKPRRENHTSERQAKRWRCRQERKTHPSANKGRPPFVGLLGTTC